MAVLSPGPSPSFMSDFHRTEVVCHWVPPRGKFSTVIPPPPPPRSFVQVVQNQYLRGLRYPEIMVENSPSALFSATVARGSRWKTFVACMPCDPGKLWSNCIRFLFVCQDYSRDFRTGLRNAGAVRLCHFLKSLPVRATLTFIERMFEGATMQKRKLVKSPERFKWFK